MSPFRAVHPGPPFPEAKQSASRVVCPLGPASSSSSSVAHVEGPPPLARVPGAAARRTFFMWGPTAPGPEGVGPLGWRPPGPCPRPSLSPGGCVGWGRRGRCACPEDALSMAGWLEGSPQTTPRGLHPAGCTPAWRTMLGAPPKGGGGPVGEGTAHAVGSPPASGGGPQLRAGGIVGTSRDMPPPRGQGPPVPRGALGRRRTCAGSSPGHGRSLGCARPSRWRTPSRRR
mmetsp:Transcript_30948/g.78394  ORF Transcript_30948/g.78394 Transcript_30948/m.78394 type:complete len:229 (+) Transcript_30948:374-1060(+)